MDIKDKLQSSNAEPLLKAVSSKLGIPPEELRAQLEAGKFDSAIQRMNPGEAAKFQQAMQNPKLIEKLMSSAQAQALYKKTDRRKIRQHPTKPVGHCPWMLSKRRLCTEGRHG